jgi:hypothetical protein
MSAKIEVVHPTPSFALVDAASRQLHDLQSAKYEQVGDVAQRSVHDNAKNCFACMRCGLLMSVLGRVLAAGDGACDE